MLLWVKKHKIISAFLVILCVFVLLILLIPTYFIPADEIRSLANRQADDISQCRAVPMGERACGGPEEYIVYSTKNTDVSRLKTLISIRDKSISIISAITGGHASICSIEMAPTSFELVKGECSEKYPF